MKKLFLWAFDREKDHRLSILQRVNLFKGLRRNFLMKLLVDLVEKEYQQGDVIFTEGEPGKALYIILDGSVSIVKKCGSEDKVLATLSMGSFFGELAIIDQMPRFASAIALEKTNLLIMYKSYFDDLIRSSNTMSAHLLLNIVELLSAYIRKNHAVHMSDRDEIS
ncbi:MAG: cyclic nucleotide-binding domain-containing protein [Nitrospirae bacterium]|nr:cyclic nucleotide-binding domain-containing protein [Nitrospirota bacterium]